MNTIKTMVFDIEVAFYPEITRMAIDRGVDEKKFSWEIDANMRYVTHISYGINTGKVIDLVSAKVGDEKQLLETFASIYNLCDEVVAHYGKKFDIRFLNSRLAYHELPPLKPLVLIDTWRIMKDHFLLVNNRLDSAIKFFKCPYEKPSLPWKVWRDVSLGNAKAHKLLQHRCHYDVLSLRWLYENKLKHHAKAGRVNKALVFETRWINDAGINDILKLSYCPSCANVGKFNRRGYKYNKTSTTVQFQCKKCNGWSTAPLNHKGLIGKLR